MDEGWNTFSLNQESTEDKVLESDNCDFVHVSGTDNYVYEQDSQGDYSPVEDDVLTPWNAYYGYVSESCELELEEEVQERDRTISLNMQEWNLISVPENEELYSINQRCDLAESIEGYYYYKEMGGEITGFLEDASIDSNRGIFVYPQIPCEVHYLVDEGVEKPGIDEGIEDSIEPGVSPEEVIRIEREDMEHSLTVHQDHGDIYHPVEGKGNFDISSFNPREGNNYEHDFRFQDGEAQVTMSFTAPSFNVDNTRNMAQTGNQIEIGFDFEGSEGINGEGVPRFELEDNSLFEINDLTDSETLVLDVLDQPVDKVDHEVEIIAYEELREGYGGEIGVNDTVELKVGDGFAKDLAYPDEDYEESPYASFEGFFEDWNLYVDGERKEEDDFEGYSSNWYDHVSVGSWQDYEEGLRLEDAVISNGIDRKLEEAEIELISTHSDGKILLEGSDGMAEIDVGTTTGGEKSNHVFRIESDGSSLTVKEEGELLKQKDIGYVEEIGFEASSSGLRQFILGYIVTLERDFEVEPGEIVEDSDKIDIELNSVSSDKASFNVVYDDVEREGDVLEFFVDLDEVEEFTCDVESGEECEKVFSISFDELVRSINDDGEVRLAVRVNAEDGTPSTYNWSQWFSKWFKIK